MSEPEKKPPRREPSRMGSALTLVLILAMAMLLMKSFSTVNPEASGQTFQNLRRFAYQGNVVKLVIRGERFVDATVTRSQRDEEWESISVPPYALETQLADLERLVDREIAMNLTLDDAIRQVREGDWQLVGGYTMNSVREGARPGYSGVFVQYMNNGQMRWAHLKGLGASGKVAELITLADEFEVKILPADVGYASKVVSEPDNDIWGGLLLTLVPWFLFIAFFLFIFSRQMRGGGGQGGIMSFGRSKVKMIPADESKVTFDQVAGVEEAKEEVAEIISFLKDPKRFSRLGGRLPRGVLLVGPPGTGKTLLAKAIAGEASVPFFAISGSDFVEMFVGVGASRVRDLFKQAKENSPCVIFLDEIDAVGRKRGAGLGGGNDEREQTLNAILVEMDGFETDSGVIMIAATNRPDVLDTALLRPGRFDRQINLDLPDIRGREAILVVHSQRVVLSDEVDLSEVARGTPMFSGAELEALMNEAALIATILDKEAIEQSDLEEARDKVRFGREKKSRVLLEEDRRLTAYHEAGHVMVAEALPDLVEPVHKVTIIPRGMALGATMQLPERDKYHHKRNELHGMLAMLYGGRVAEEKFCEDISGGASNDIERATDIARMMVCNWGMSESLGPVSYGESRGEVFMGDELIRSKNYSEKTSEAIDEEVRQILNRAHLKASEIIEGHREEMERLTEALMHFETLSGAEVRALLKGATVHELRTDEDRPAEDSRPPEASSAPPSVPAEPEDDEGFDSTNMPLPEPA
ncbi:MAG: cell division protease FtsH [Pseudohongiellaceae bacterium]|jgi:cell division protease FtsH